MKKETAPAATKEQQKVAEMPTSGAVATRSVEEANIDRTRDKGQTVSRTVAGYEVGDVGTGFEDFDQNDLAIPFITILQKGSPQVEEDNPKQIKGSKASNLMNTVTNEIMDGKDQGVVVIPVHRTRTYIEWIPKDDGGGLVAVYDPNDPKVLAALGKGGKKFGKVKINDNNDLVETFNVFALRVREDGRTERVVIGFASSQIGPYKKWMTTAQSIQVEQGDGRMATPPMFSHKYRLKTIFFQKGEYTWFKWVPGFAGSDAASSRIAATDPLYEEAKAFRALILAGVAKANFDGLSQDEHDDTEATGYNM